MVTGYRVKIARGARRWEEAERLQGVRVDWNRQRAAPILVKSPRAWDAKEKNFVRTLAVSLQGQASIQREQGSAACVEGYREALALDEQVADTQGAAVCAFNLGRAYEELDGISDLALAEQWYQRSLELLAKADRMGRARCLGQLGSVAHARFLGAREAARPPEECFGHLVRSERCYTQALEMFPTSAVQDLAVAHSQLAVVWAESGQIDTALRHCREAIRHHEANQDRFGAGTTRFNAARALAGEGRPADARDWAQAALRDYQMCANVDQYVVKTLKLLEHIESDLRVTSPPS
jgi:tetratricopeptide (TPR) repeat protein